jgi:hypothetical protein
MTRPLIPAFTEEGLLYPPDEKLMVPADAGGVMVWFDREGHRRWRFAGRAWCATKRDPSFADMLAESESPLDHVPRPLDASEGLRYGVWVARSFATAVARRRHDFDRDSRSGE